jgi:uncharacterized membrane protein YcaP (DUF421 family)
MEAVLRIAAVYFLLMFLVRLSGHRTLADISPFDFVLLLVISELVQQAVVGRDPSLTQAAVLCGTLVGLDIVLAEVKERWPRVARWMDGMPILLVESGRPLREAMRRERIDEADVLAAARLSRGLERIDQIRYAVLESTGGISIVPEESAERAGGRSESPPPAQHRGQRPRQNP